ncbi:MAG: Ycf66 family protein [Cyanobacteriota bacterium]|nr:Ycf66 family protein [Cyanobacteriota bacterium]
MLATLGGLLALLLGSAILLLPLLTPELSRPRDAAWGALVLLLGLDLVTCADRLSGAPMLGVLCAGLLIGRLGSEVGRARWCMLTPEERQQLRSAARWQRSLDQLLAASNGLLEQARGVLAGLAGAVGVGRRSSNTGSGKRWVRPDTPSAAAAPATIGTEPAAVATGEGSEPEAARADGSGGPPPAPPVREVSDFGAIDTLLIEAGSLSPEPGAGSGTAGSAGETDSPGQRAAAAEAAPPGEAPSDPEASGEAPAPAAAPATAAAAAEEPAEETPDTGMNGDGDGPADPGVPG